MIFFQVPAMNVMALWSGRLQRMSSRWKTCATAFSLMALAVLVPATLGPSLFGQVNWWRAPFQLLCHGIASHSFSIAGTAMPICARCTGIYAGLLLGILFSYLGTRTPRKV